jgi:hypothetical protein
VSLSGPARMDSPFMLNRSNSLRLYKCVGASLTLARLNV